MDFVTATAVGVSVVGVVVMLAGFLARHKGGRFLLLLGAALIAGSMSPLLKGRVTETVQILCSVGAIVLALAGSAICVVDVRRRRVHRLVR
jgi:hypothetical protein